MANAISDLAPLGGKSIKIGAAENVLLESKSILGVPYLSCQQLFLTLDGKRLTSKFPLIYQSFKEMAEQESSPRAVKNASNIRGPGEAK
jgi:hypothetical protein